MNLIFASNE